MFWLLFCFFLNVHYFYFIWTILKVFIDFVTVLLLFCFVFRVMFCVFFFGQEACGIFNILYSTLSVNEKIKSKKKVPSATTSEKEEAKKIMVRHFPLGQYDIIFQRYFWEPKAVFIQFALGGVALYWPAGFLHTASQRVSSVQNVGQTSWRTEGPSGTVG